jgi:hypothetical protein
LQTVNLTNGGKTHEEKVNDTGIEISSGGQISAIATMLTGIAGTSGRRAGFIQTDEHVSAEDYTQMNI